MAIEEIQVIPLTPIEVAIEAKEANYVPPEVIDIVNDMLVKAFVRQTDVIKLAQKDIIQKMIEIEFIDASEVETVLASNWLDFGTLFEQYGWRVVFQEVYGEMKNMYTFRKK